MSDALSPLNQTLQAPRSLDEMLARVRRSECDREGDGECDADVTVCELWAPAWDHEALVGLRQGLGGRRLVLVEPVAGRGWRRLVQRLLAPLWRRRLGHTFERDLTPDLVAAGFRLETFDRFSVGPLGLHTYVHARLSG